MSCVPRFCDEEREAEVGAYREMTQIPRVALLTEFQVMKATACYLGEIANCMIGWPLKAVRERNVHAGCVVISMVLPLAVLHVGGLSFVSGFSFMRQQLIYKLWSVYGLAMIVLRYLFKVHRFTHSVMYRAVAEKCGLILPVLWHSVSNLLVFACLSVCAGTFIAGLFGKAGVFFAACVHTQATIIKRFLPKPLEQDSAVQEPLSRLLVLFALAVHLTYGQLRQVLLMIEFEFGCAFARWILMSLTFPTFYDKLRSSVAALRASSKFEESLLLRFPAEAFAMAVASLVLVGPAANSAAIAATTLFSYVAAQLTV